MDKDEKFSMSDERGDFWIRKGGSYQNKMNGGIQLAFKVDMTDHALSSQTGFNFEELSDQIIKQELDHLHNENRWDCLLYEWNGVDFEKVDPQNQTWFKC